MHSSSSNQNVYSHLQSKKEDNALRSGVNWPPGSKGCLSRGTCAGFRTPNHSPLPILLCKILLCSMRSRVLCLDYMCERQIRASALLINARPVSWVQHTWNRCSLWVMTSLLMVDDWVRACSCQSIKKRNSLCSRNQLQASCLVFSAIQDSSESFNKELALSLACSGKRAFTFSFFLLYPNNVQNNYVQVYPAIHSFDQKMVYHRNQWLSRCWGDGEDIQQHLEGHMIPISGVQAESLPDTTKVPQVQSDPTGSRLESWQAAK